MYSNRMFTSKIVPNLFSVVFSYIYVIFYIMCLLLKHFFLLNVLYVRYKNQLTWE